MKAINPSEYFDFSVSESGRSVVSHWKSDGTKHTSEFVVSTNNDQGALKVDINFPAWSVFANACLEYWLLEQGFAPAVDLDDEKYRFHVLWHQKASKIHNG